eukprot:Hpha_TRINITY_DN16374_c4_g1::TRINITY_DN16374_c4_g1_i7::g.61983::m.61983
MAGMTIREHVGEVIEEVNQIETQVMGSVVSYDPTHVSRIVAEVHKLRQACVAVKAALSPSSSSTVTTTAADAATPPAEGQEAAALQSVSGDDDTGKGTTLDSSVDRSLSVPAAAEAASPPAEATEAAALSLGETTFEEKQVKEKQEQPTVAEVMEPGNGAMKEPMKGVAKQVESWRLDTANALSKEQLEAARNTPEGKKQLRELKEELDACVKWCDKYPEEKGPGQAAEAVSAEHDDQAEEENEGAGKDASKAKQEDFVAALAQMETRAEELRKKGAKGERVIQFTDDTTPTRLLEWVESLPSVQPNLGYVAPKHIANLATTIRRVVAGAGMRVGERDN